MESSTTKPAKRRIGISVSESEDTSAEMLQLFVSDIATNLLLTGNSVAYGGDLRPGGFSELLSDTGYRHRYLQRDDHALIDQYLPYPCAELATEEVIKTLKESSTHLHTGALQYEEKEVASFSNLWAGSLSSLREQMATETVARILLGGKTNEYYGKMPGLIEEARLTLEQNKPLYLIGQFGGATRQVIDAIEGRDFSYNQDDFHQSHEYMQFRYTYNSKMKHTKINEQENAAFFKTYGVEKLSQRNGLTVEENKILFYSTNKSEVLYCLFKGLKTVKQ